MKNAYLVTNTNKKGLGTLINKGYTVHCKSSFKKELNYS